MKVSVELPEIEGYEYTGEFRAPQYGENYLNTLNLPSISMTISSGCESEPKAIILRPKRWRAKEGSNYYTIAQGIGGKLRILRKFECFIDGDDTRHILGNYYKTEKLALEALERVKKALLG